MMTKRTRRTNQVSKKVQKLAMENDFLKQSAPISEFIQWTDSREKAALHFCCSRLI